ncbi:MAG TPA: phosphate ABC transporter permease PstA [Fibrobacteria bacterium]|nr:phosphate ABC transporter permease PstA [Fibrobacteria bacterium]
MTDRHYRMRRVKDKAMHGIFMTMAILVMVPLASMVVYVAVRGLKRLDLDFFLHLPAPVGEPGGGMGNAILGTISMVAIACGVSLPISIMAAIYLAEFGKQGRYAFLIRFTADVLSGVPSIVTGIFVYQVLVRRVHHFSGLAGGLALGIIMIPLVTRTTEELIKLVPRTLTEASLALGVARWKTTLLIVLHAARGGIVTGVLLAVARVAGETAPLLFTALNNQYWPSGIDQPTASLTVQVFTYAIAPFQDWQDQAWTGALVLLIMVFGVGLGARLALRRTLIQMD